MGFESLTKNIFLLALITLSSCQTPPQRNPADVTRGQSQRNKSADEIAVYLEGQEVKYIKSPVRSFKINTLESLTELNKLKNYIQSQKKFLDINDSTDVQLRTLSVQKRNSKTIVRLQQVIERQVNGQRYIIPIESSSLIATFEGRRLESISSDLTNPPSINLIFDHPGFDTSQFSEKQMEKLVSYIRASENEQKIRSYLSTIATNSNIPFDFDKFLQATSQTQLKMMRIFFSKIKPISTAKLIIDLARKEKLALIKHGSQWMFQVTHFLDLPIQFDIVIPGLNDQAKQLKVKNLRDLYRVLNVQVFSQTDFPGGDKDLRLSWDDKMAQATTFPSTQASDVASGELFKNVTHYFRSNFSWIGFNGQDDTSKITIVKDISNLPWAENAFWYKEGNFLGIGAGGDSLTNLSGSVSTLAHEYTHAIIDNSSQIAYRGQSGAINEHLADIQGIGAEAWVTQTLFDYTIGEDILTPLIKEPQKDVILEEIKKGNISTLDVEKFSIREVALRNLYYPAASIFRQMETMNEVNTQYGPTCEPSVDNDNCGVHYAAGVPSRAASLIIGSLGFEKTKKIFFNTMTYRLGANPTFQEYLRQLHEECLLNPLINPDQDCPVIIKSFESVGVTYPMKPTPPPQKEKPDGGAIPLPISELPQIYCGQITKAKVNSFTLVDNKFDALVILPENKIHFQNHFTKALNADFEKLKTLGCFCMKAHIEQIQDNKGTWVNFLSQIYPQTLSKQNSSLCSKIDLQ